LLLSLGLIALTFAHLLWFYGMRMELDGTGMRPIFSFGDPQSHYAEIEQSRQQQHASLPEPRPGAPEAVEPATASAASAEGVAHAAATAAPAPVTLAWADYRGANRDGHYTQTRIRTAWPPAGLPQLWRVKVGGGYASVVIAEGRVFTIEQRRGEEVVAAYDFDTGRELWTHSWPAHFQESMGGPGPRATPVWHEGKVYALGAEGELRCLRAETGTLVWKKNILSDNGVGNLHWAMSAAPLIVDEKVVVLPGGSGGRSISAYNKNTGEPVWKSLDDRQSYASPMLVRLAGRRQILVVSGSRLLAVTPEDGALLWSYRWEPSPDINASQPIVVDENHVFVSSAYGQGAALVKITARGDSLQAEEVWRNTLMKNKFNSSVLHEGNIYGLDEGILACVDARTGERKWKGGRYGFGQVLLADGHLIVLTERGEVALVKATPEAHQEVASFSALSGKTWNNPAITDGRLIVRNQTEMASYDIRPR
jgi:outer membrane protein assembly factor BamB